MILIFSFHLLMVCTLTVTNSRLLAAGDFHACCKIASYKNRENVMESARVQFLFKSCNKTNERGFANE